MDKYFIGPVNSGLRKDLVPFLAPEDAFEKLTNMFIYNGKITRRFPRGRLVNDSATDPYSLESRLKFNLGATDGAGAFPPTVALGTGAIGQQFSVDGQLFTVYQANGAMHVSPDDGATGTFNIATSTVTIAGATALASVYWYPCQPVLGLVNFFDDDGDYLLFAFDNNNAYIYDRTLGLQQVTIGFDNNYTYRISSEQFRSDTIGNSALIITTYNDQIRYYDNVGGTFTPFLPVTFDPLTSLNWNIRRCGFVISFQERLLLMNTVEHEGNLLDRFHRNRIRYSESGDIFNADSWWATPSASNKGGIVDLPADNKIVCAAILNNRLIIFCENQIHEAISTGNTIRPFDTELIDDTMGSSISNVIKVNNSLLFVNNYGVYIYDGRNIKKINNILGDEFEDVEFRFSVMHKDISRELIYIPYNTVINEEVPNRVLVYNYRNNTFSIIVDQYVSLISSHYDTDATFVAPATFIGNNYGYINLTLLSEEDYKNAPSELIANITRIDGDTLELHIKNHLLVEDSYIRVENSAIVELNISYKVDEVVSDDAIRVFNNDADITDYNGDAVISYIDEIYIKTKEFNFYMKDGFGTFINKVTFNLNRTDDAGEYTMAAAPDGAAILPAIYLNKGFKTTADELITHEAFQARIWRDVYIQLKGSSVALEIYFSDLELTDDEKPYQDLTINAMIIHTSPSSNF